MLEKVLKEKLDSFIDCYYDTKKPFVISMLENEELVLQEDISLHRRINHYSSYCFDQQKHTSFYQSLFINEGSNYIVLARKVDFFVFNKSQVKIRIHPAVPYRDILFSSSMEADLLNALDDVVLISEAEPLGSPGPRIIFVNEAFTRMTGWDAKDVIGKSPRMLQGENTEIESRKTIAMGLKSWDVIKVEITNYRKDQSEHTVDLHIHPVKDETGWWTHWIAIQRDISIVKEKRLQEEKAALMNDRLQKKGKIGYWELDVASGSTFWSEEVYRIHGVKVGTPTAETKGIAYYTPQDQVRISKYIEHCIRDQQEFDDIFELYDEESNKKWVRSYGEPIVGPTGSVERIFGTFQDITDVHNKEKDLQLVLEGLAVGIWKLDLIKNTFFWDKSTYNLYGISEESFTGDYGSWESILHPDDRDRVSRELREAIEGIKDFNSTFAIISGDGSIRHIGARAQIEYDNNGKAMFMTGVNYDRTEEVITQKELEDEREASVHQSKLASIGELAAGVGHEINNPLAISTGISYNLKKILEENGVDIPEVSDLLNKQGEAHLRIKNIVDGLRNLSRTDGAKVEVFDAFDSIHANVLLVKDIYLKDGIVLKFNGKKGHGIKGNVGEFQQVMMNLLSNAKDAVKEQEQPQIAIELCPSDKLIHISVKDNGRGIPEDIQEKIFTPFFTTKEVGSGTGLGLGIVRKLVEKAHGSIEVVSTIGEGTCITLVYPLTTLRSAERPQGKRVKLSPVVEKEAPVFLGRALVVDDEDVLRDVIAVMLKDLGMKVTKVGSGEEALKCLESEYFDYVFSDLKMPKMNGVELIKLASQKKISSQYFLMTGGITKKIKEDTELMSLICGILLKPFDIDEVKEVLANATKRTA